MIRQTLLVAGLSLVASGAAEAQKAEPLDLSLLYLGNAGTPRAEAFETFLSGQFESVRVADRDTFDPATVGDADVVLLDWSQRDVMIMKMDEITSPLGPRESWTTPTVLLGSAGLLIAAPWQTNGAYG